VAEALLTLIERRKPSSVDAYDRAFREVAQELMLLGLWRAKFFEHAAFYGGTALRLLHGLDRFSEGLDFSLLKADPDFRFDAYFDAIRRELEAFGLDADFQRREKESVIESAFMKMNTKKAMISIGVPDRITATVPFNRLVKVKFEADTDPPPGFLTESKLLLEPSPFGVKVYSPDCLFAGKFHALLARSWQGRVKGRDWFDLVFFVRRDIPVHLPYLRSRLVVSGNSPVDALSGEDARGMLRGRIESLDVAMAKADVRTFIPDPSSLDLWSREFFLELAAKIRFREA